MKLWMIKVFSLTYFIIPNSTVSIGYADDPQFLRPVNSAGETIQDVELLTITDQLDQPQHAEREKREILPAEKIVLQKNLKFQRMREQLSELSLIWEEMRRQQNEIKNGDVSKPIVKEPSSVLQESENADELDRNVEPDQQSFDISETNIPPVDELVERSIQTERMDQTNHLTDRKPASENSDDAVALQQDSNTPIDEPVDRFALATSLYAVGHYRQALQAIDTIQLVQLTDYEQVWLDYLRAGCHRKSGEYDVANRLYRRIVANPESDWMGAAARWWLDHSAEKQQLETDYLALTAAIQQWEIAVDELTK